MCYWLLAFLVVEEISLRIVLHKWDVHGWNCTCLLSQYEMILNFFHKNYYHCHHHSTHYLWSVLSISNEITCNYKSQILYNNLPWNYSHLQNICVIVLFWYIYLFALSFHWCFVYGCQKNNPLHASCPFLESTCHLYSAVFQILFPKVWCTYFQDDSVIIERTSPNSFL